jgi:hypothetical protein
MQCLQIEFRICVERVIHLKGKKKNIGGFYFWRRKWFFVVLQYPSHILKGAKALVKKYDSYSLQM